MSEKIKIRLQGHEKFPLRDGWLNKGLIIVDEEPKIFNSKEAPETFGIGNNMVKSIRYWLTAFDLIVSKASKGTELTETAQLIKKYDLYFEDVFTLWVLHSNIANNNSEATSWYMYFNRSSLADYSKEELFASLNLELQKYVNDQKYSEQSLKNDIDVLLNMYGKENAKSDPEEKNTSPFSALGLVKQTDEGYSRTQPDLRLLNEWVVLYQLATAMEGKDTISIDQAITGEKSLGAVLQLNNVSCNYYLDRLDDLGYIRVDRTAGLDMIYRKKDFSKIDVIKTYYERAKGNA